ncbi:cytochrome P450 52A12 [Dothidotthia symphoricarpi CBS 119687]|uniref:Cytochrome P450 52A12 n=1 Tax=Dothidotthia symphoricarpi CBS 119687 TaxID=1392245 RepID=A0A6A6AFG5_9PLEO|nr:cytochrome P450 52A12 [Dothidotthia symphoricarpi CBS 119687]KAF2129778.1 cytochrome P450 52A12 [Dothidotthia symphoricarpi CBS 119687]
MHSSLLLALWAFVSFVIYKAVSSIVASRRHANAARQLGCEPPHRLKCVDPVGFQNVAKILKADKECRMPAYFKSCIDEISAEKGRLTTTIEQKIMGSTCFFTIEPKNIQAVLATQFKDFGMGHVRNSNFGALLGRGIFSSDGKEWEHSRALLRPQFARDQVSDLELEELHMQSLMQVLPVNKEGWTNIVDIQPLFFRLTLDSATEFLFGDSVDSQLSSQPGYISSKAPMAVSEKEFAVSFDRAQAAIAKGARMDSMYWLAHNKEFKEHCNRCHTFIDHYVQLALSKEKLAMQKTSSGKDKYVFLDAVVESSRDPIMLRDQMLSILLAGRDTTASLLSFAFMVFTQRPDVYAKLRAVVLEEFGTYTHPKDISFSRLKSCNHLQWVINETLRLYPVVPYDGRRALRDTTIPTGGGPSGTSPIYVRKGQQVDYSVYAMHRRKDLWGPDADEFKPERWDGRKSGWEYLPFNGGPRICIGQQFALTEAGYVIVRLCQRFEAIEGVGNSWEKEEQGGQGRVRMWVTLTGCPADGVKVRMKEAKE